MADAKTKDKGTQTEVQKGGAAQAADPAPTPEPTQEPAQSPDPAQQGGQEQAPERDDSAPHGKVDWDVTHGEDPRSRNEGDF
jgi:hypothetical protein